jgi:putative phosphoribosyl transferase
MGAISSAGVCVLNGVVDALGVTEEELASTIAREKQELERRERLYRGGRPAPAIGGRSAILVDDGLATGSSMRAAVIALRRRQPARIIVAVPVGSPETCAEFRSEADETVCAATPDPFYSVGCWYEDFAQTTDEEVHGLLTRAVEETAPVHQRV